MDRAAQDAAAERFVRDRYGERASPPRPLSAGEWSRAYAFRLDGQEAVIRFGAYGEDFAKDERMARHNAPGLPIPRVLEVGRTPEGYFAVSERAYGGALDALDGPGMRTVLPDLLRTLDAIAELPVPGGGGYGGWGPDGTAGHASWGDALLDLVRPRPRLAGWRETLEQSPEDARAFDRGVDRLRELVGDLPQERHIIHSDLLYHNVLVEDGRITAVLDWGNSLYGDQLYDAAWLIYWWPWYPAWADTDIRGELTRHWARRGAQPADADRRLQCYLLHIGLDSIAYNAFTERWDNLRRNVAQIQGYMRGM